MKNYTWGEMLGRWLPAEILWMCTDHARGGRLSQLRAYVQAITYAWERWRRRRARRSTAAPTQAERSGAGD